MRRKNQTGISVNKNTGSEFRRLRDELGVTSDELLRYMIELYRPRTWLFKLFKKATKWM